MRGGGVITFLYIPKGGSSLFWFPQRGGHMFLWGVLMVATGPPPVEIMNGPLAKERSWRQGSSTFSHFTPCFGIDPNSSKTVIKRVIGNIESNMSIDKVGVMYSLRGSPYSQCIFLNARDSFIIYDLKARGSKSCLRQFFSIRKSQKNYWVNKITQMQNTIHDHCCFCFFFL